MIWNEILCLGDSLTYGARDRYGRSYPAELGKILSEKTGEFYICHNYGINGETSSDLLRRSWGYYEVEQKLQDYASLNRNK
jgi:lysophospholipase L1-like esterase